MSLKMTQEAGSPLFVPESPIEYLANRIRFATTQPPITKALK